MIGHRAFDIVALWAAVLACLYFAARRWQLAHAIADTARARVRSAPHGYVELYGQARCVADAKKSDAPLTGRRCVWWEYRIDRRAGRGWSRVDGGTSDGNFLLQDETGTCQVDPEHARVTPSTRQVWYGSEDWPTAPYSTGLGALGSNYRYVEQRIHELDRVCVLGELTAVGGVAGGDADLEVAALLHAWKSDPATLKRFDRDGDGQLDATEWEEARSAARAQVLAHQASEPVIKRMIKPADGRPYILAARDPQRLARMYRWQAVASLAGFFLALIVLTQLHVRP